MNDFLIGLCQYLALQGPGNTACQKAITATYAQTGAKTYIDTQQKQVETYGANLYTQLPYNQSLGAIGYVGYSIYKNDYKLPLSNHIFLEYNGTQYTCNLKWSLE